MKNIRVIKGSEVEKETKIGVVCLYYSSEFRGIHVPEESLKKILNGAKFCVVKE